MNKWYAMEQGAIEKKLETNLSSGLSRKEAHLRLRRFGFNNIYKSIRKPFVYHITNLFSDITVIFSFIMVIIDMLFGGEKRSPVLLSAFILSVLVSVVCSIISHRKYENAYEHSYPMVSVIRENAVYRIDVRDVVIGDILLLKKGDVVPCDCRLLKSDGLRAIEFTGKISGKEQKTVTVKDANVSYQANANLGIAERKNMISAAAVITSGNCKAVAVATGSRTFIGMILGELDVVSQRKNELAVEKKIHGFLSKCSTAFLISIIPLALLSMILQKNSYSTLDVINTFLVIILFSSSSVMYNVFKLGLSSPYSTENENCDACIKTASALAELNYVDSVIIAGNESFSYNDKTISSIYTSNRFFNLFGTENQHSDDLENIVKLAFIGSYTTLNSVSVDGENSENGYTAIESLADTIGIDTAKLFEEYEITEFTSKGFDTTLVKKGDDHIAVCLGSTAELIGLCTDIRMSGDLQTLDVSKKSEIIKLYKDFTSRSQKVIFVASRISPCSSLSRLGAVQNQLTFEGMLIFDAPYTSTFAASVSELRNADINVYYFAEENAESIITAFNTGLIKSKKEIAYASAFAATKKTITSGFGQYKAYLGFGAKQLSELEGHIKGTNGTVAVIACDTNHISLVNAANVSATVSDLSNKKRSITSISYTSEIVKRNVDVLIPMPTKTYGGFEAFCRAIKKVRMTCKTAVSAVKYLSFSAVTKIVLLVLSLVFDRELISPLQAAFIGIFTDVPAMIFFSAIKTENNYRIEDIETFFASPIKHLSKYIASACLFGIVVFLMATVFGAYGIATSEPLSVFTTISVLFGDLFAFLTLHSPRVYDKKTKVILISWGVVLLLLVIVSIAVPSVGTLLGISYPGWQICSAAPITAVIGYIIIFVTDRYF